MKWEYIAMALVLITFFSVTIYILRSIKLNTRDIILAGLFAALTAVGAFLRIPLPVVPFTMQLFFCVFAGILLGSKVGMLSQLIYVLIGLCGIPVFTKGGGPAYIFQTSFGYLIGFVVGAYAAGKTLEIIKKYNVFTCLIACLVGTLFIYLIGVPYIYLISTLYFGSEMTLWYAVVVGFLTPIGGDLVSCVLVSIIGLKIRQVLVKNNYI